MGGRGSSSGLSNGSGISTVERKICHDEVESAYLFDTDGNVIFSKGSTIIDCSSDDIKILREGPITIEQINEIVNYK